MSKNVKYDVLRDHEGDRFYREGETRELSDTSAKHLVRLGVLAEHDPKRKKRVTLTDSELIARREALKAELEEMTIAREKLLDEQNRIQRVISNAAKDLEDRRSELNGEIDDLTKQRDQIMTEVNDHKSKLATAQESLTSLNKQVEKAKEAAASLNKAEGASPKNKAAASPSNPDE